MNDRGQILLLSALVVCACLIALAACLYSVSAAYENVRPALGRDTVDNVKWVQDAGLAQAAGETGGCGWEDRTSLAESYKSKADQTVSGIERSLLARGIAYSFTYNETLGRDYIEEDPTSSAECIGGVLLKRDSGNASVCGCAYDVSLADGSTAYRLAAVKIWA